MSTKAAFAPAAAASAFLSLVSLAACAPSVERPPSSRPPPSPGALRGGEMQVRFVDVGQGDAAIVETSDGHAWLVDAGPPEGAARLGAALTALHRDLDGVFLSHAHADHYGGLAPLTTSGRVAPRLFLPAIAPEPTKTFSKLLGKLRESGVEVVPAARGTDVALGAYVSARAILPEAPALTRTRSDMNANSLILAVVHRSADRQKSDVRVLFEGDAEEETETRLLGRSGELAADVLKVAHHGSRYASRKPFLDAVHPRWAVISCGGANEYGHPHEGALDRLAAAKVEVHRTDLEGDVVFRSDPEGARIAGSRTVDPKAVFAPGTPKGRSEVSDF